MHRGVTEKQAEELFFRPKSYFRYSVFNNYSLSLSGGKDWAHAAEEEDKGGKEVVGTDFVAVDAPSSSEKALRASTSVQSLNPIFSEGNRKALPILFVLRAYCCCLFQDEEYSDPKTRKEAKIRSHRHD